MRYPAYLNLNKEELNQRVKKAYQAKLVLRGYFNNDFHGYAVQNAQGLTRFLIGA